MIRHPIPASQRELVKLSLIVAPHPRAGKGHDARHHGADERGWR